MDSGTPSHVVKESILSTPVDHSRATPIRTAKQGDKMFALGRVTEGEVVDGLAMRDDELEKKLVSISKFDLAGYKTVFYKGICRVTDPDTERTILEAKLDRTTNLYMFDIRTLLKPESANMISTTPKMTVSLWHKRLGHRSKRLLLLWRNQGIIRGIPAGLKMTDADQRICDACTRAKSRRHSMPKTSLREFTKTPKTNHVPNSMKPKILQKSELQLPVDDDLANSDDEDSTVELNFFRNLSTARPVTNDIREVSTDIKGPFATQGRKGEIYYQGFIESDSMYHFAYFMKTKSEALENVRHLLESHFLAEDSTVRSYRSDGALELIQAAILTYLASKHTKTAFSPPHNPEMNSIVERNHRTIFESAHAMLLETRLPLTFWSDAVRYASLIFNCLPTTTAYGMLPPVTAKYGIIPNIAMFRKFGCLVYIHIPAATRSKGFVDKAYKGKFLGICLKTWTYIGYIIELDRVVIDSSMVFDEDAPVNELKNHGMLEFDNETKSVKDFTYLIGMIYRDDEDNFLYVTTRIVIQKGLLVAYRAIFLNGAAAQELPRPEHVRDVSKMLELYLQSNRPIILCEGRPVTLDCV